jgi:hypothetical protein
VIRWESWSVIDNPLQTDVLIAKLKAALPFPARATPDLLAQLREQMQHHDLSPRCQVAGIHYLGDEGGIVCKLDIGTEDGGKAFFVSITHLSFDPRLPLAREIAAYQKHRIKRITRTAGPRPRGSI